MNNYCLLKSSELEAVTFNSLNKCWLEFNSHVLVNCILVELCGSSTKKILFVFKIIFLKVINNSRDHMSMIFARSNARFQNGSCVPVKICDETPSGYYNKEEIEENVSKTLFRALKMWWVEMHVIFRCEIVIKNSVNVF